MTAVFKREFRSYFTSPLGYVYLAIFLCFESFFFVNLFSNGAPQLEVVFPTLASIVIILCPVLTMRLLSEDRKQKVDQALLTAPVSVSGIVCGKFFAALAVYALSFAPTLIFEIVFSLVGSPYWPAYLNALFGAIVIGAALISVGMFISSLTESPIISCILTLVIFLLLQLLPNLASLTGSEILVNVANKIAFVNLFSSFSTSIFSIVNTVYVLSIAAVFVFLSVRMVERRRWA